MDMTVDALKNLYVALGGKTADVADMTLIPDVINAIATVAASTVELPAVSGSDNGSVLTVVEGKWAKAAVPSELPAVTAEDNGDVLKVIDGVWAKGTDEIQA